MSSSVRARRTRLRWSADEWDLPSAVGAGLCGLSSLGDGTFTCGASTRARKSGGGMRLAGPGGKSCPGRPRRRIRSAGTNGSSQAGTCLVEPFKRNLHRSNGTRTVQRAGRALGRRVHGSNRALEQGKRPLNCSNAKLNRSNEAARGCSLDKFELWGVDCY